MNFLPESASTFAAELDAFALYITAVSGTITVLLCVAIVYFAIKYRRSKGPALGFSYAKYGWIEWVWTIFPIFIMVSMFGWGAKIYMHMEIEPNHAEPIFVIAKQWMWKFEHPGGQREINTLHVPLGRPVKLILVSQDLIHSFFVPAFRVKQDVVPGRYTYAWFKATKLGTYRLHCAELCGTNHSEMGGSVTVLSPADYEAWLQKNANIPSARPQVPTEGNLTEVGRQVFERGSCTACHGDPGRAPSLVGLYGKRVELADGSSVIADETYIRESILRPQAKIVARYPNIMPSFQGLLTERELMGLIDYIRTLSEKPASGGPSYERAH